MAEEQRGAPVLALADEAARIEVSLRALDNAPIGMVVADRLDTVVWANAAFAALVGATGRVEGQHLDALVTTERAPDAQRRLDAMIGGTAPAYEAEERWFLRNGEARAVLVNAAPADPGGSSALVVLQALDTTESRRAREELERSNEELTQFAYVASHDLSEPLRVISGHVELLAQRYADKLDDDAREWIAFAVDGCARMRSLIDDLLLYSRAGRQLSLSGVDLGEVARDAARDQPADIRIGPLPTVRGDRTLLTQTFGNLVSNAVKFARDGVPPVVEIEAERDGHDWRITVADNGVGIAPQHRDRVFRIFQRLHARADYPGTGIGLAIVRKAVEQMGGRVWADESPLGGAAFHLTLPATEVTR